MLQVRALGWGRLLRPFVGPQFRPDQKVKLDKSEARGGGSFLTSWLFAESNDVGGSGGPLLEKREKGRTPSYFGTPSKTNPGYTSALKWPTRGEHLLLPK